MERLGSHIRLTMERYARQTMVDGFGQDGQRRLSSASALIVGLGGLGAPVAMYLASSGIGRLGLCDNDTVSLTNLQRQVLYTERDLGQPKTLCAANRLRAMSSATVLDIHPDGLTEDNAAAIIAGYDIVVDCTDNFKTRMLIDAVCAGAGKPWVHGSIDGLYGTVAVFNHRSGRRYTDLYPDADALANARRRVIGTIGPVPGIVGSIQALETIKVLTGCGESLDGQILSLDLNNMSIEKIQL